MASAPHRQTSHDQQPASHPAQSTTSQEDLLKAIICTPESISMQGLEGEALTRRRKPSAFSHSMIWDRKTLGRAQSAEHGRSSPSAHSTGTAESCYQMMAHTGRGTLIYGNRSWRLAQVRLCKQAIRTPPNPQKCRPNAAHPIQQERKACPDQTTGPDDQLTRAPTSAQGT